MVLRRASSMSKHASEGLWLAALAAVLLLVGFKRERYAGAAYARKARSGDLPVPEGSYEADRGRLAETPSEIPARGWKDILLRVYQNIGNDHVVALAAGVTF
jgi:membrane protein